MSCLYRFRSFLFSALSPLRCLRALPLRSAAFAPVAFAPSRSLPSLLSRSRVRSLRALAPPLSPLRWLRALAPSPALSRSLPPLRCLCSRARPLRGVWWRAVLFVLSVVSVLFSARATLFRPSVWLKNPKTREAEPLLYLLRVAPSLFRLSLPLCLPLLYNRSNSGFSRKMLRH